jgi:hypothetical protein
VAVVIVLAALIGVIAWAIATYASGSGSTNHQAPTPASVLSTLTTQQRQYVLGLAVLSPAQLAAAFGTGPVCR